MTKIRKFTPSPGSRSNGTGPRPGRGQHASVSGTPRGKVKLPDYLTKSQVDVLLGSTTAMLPQAYLPMMLQWRAGLRISEAVMLQWPDVDLDSRQLFIRNAKAGDRTVPIQDQLLEELQAIRRYRLQGPFLIRLTARRIRQCYAAVVRHSVSLWPVDVPEISSKKIVTHTFRRSAAIHWMYCGVPTNQIQKWLGHKNLATTQIYLDLVSDLEGMMDRVT